MFKRNSFFFLLIVILALTLFLSLSNQQDSVSQKQTGIIHKRVEAYQGVNLFHNEHDRAFLMDLDGNIVHQWNIPGENDKHLHHVRMDSAGNLYVNYQVISFLKISWDSKLIWEKKMNVHHDFDFTSDGNLVALGKKWKRYQFKGQEYAGFMDTLMEISSETGEVLRERFLTPILAQYSEHKFVQKEIRSKTAKNEHPDFFHCNSIQVIRKPIDGIAKVGDLLIGVRNSSTVIVIDPESLELKWSYTDPSIQMMHQAHFLDNGNLLMLDNGVIRKASRALEYSPKQKRIIWTFPDRPSKALFSRRRGGAQRLPNGNTLINFSEADYAVEVTQDDQIVWLFKYEQSDNLKDHWNPFKGPYRIERLSLESLAFLR